MMGGRGRGRGSSHTFSREINERMGITTGNAPGQNNETQVEAVNEPPPLYPPLENRPVPLDTGVEGLYNFFQLVTCGRLTCFYFIRQLFIITFLEKIFKCHFVMNVYMI